MKVSLRWKAQNLLTTTQDTDMANDVLVNLEATDKKYEAPDQEKDLMGWLNSLTSPWRDYRDNNFKQRWDEYYRLWRGVFKETDRTRKSERSKLISPALQQAIEATVAEIEEAIFGQGKWFDARQDILDAADPTQRQLLDVMIKRLREDLERAGVRESCSEVFLLGVLFGTGIGKMSIDKVPSYILNDQLELGEEMKWEVGLTPVDPREFLCDPTARNVDESIGVVHELIVPKADVLRKMSEGIYRAVEIGTTAEPDKTMDDTEKNNYQLDRVKIFEYHGLVPESLIPVKVADDEEFVDLIGEIKGESEGIDITESKLVEAIVVIANDGILLKAVKNPLPRGDRAFIAYQHDTVPNRFWGRGVAEKGYNPQKALDAELRGRIDAMAYAIHPMMAVDATKMPRGTRFTIEPGKTVLTNGPPSDAFMPFNFGSVNPNSFPQGQDLERMVQMGTGAIEMGQAGAGPIGNTVGGMTLLTAASIKRTKRTLANIERSFMSPLVHKAAWRYMFFDTERYPAKDMKFQVFSSLGMMAKELESSQYMNMLKTVDSGSPGYWMLMRGVYENSSLGNRESMIAICDKMIESTMNPPEPAPDPMVEVTKLDIESRERTAKLNARIALMRARAELMNVKIKNRKADAEEANLDADSVLKLTKAEATDLDAEIKAFLQEVDSLKDKSTEEEIEDESEASTGTISE